MNGAQLDTHHYDKKAVTFFEKHDSCYTTRQGTSCGTISIRRGVYQKPDHVHFDFGISNWKGVKERHSQDGSSVTLTPEQMIMVLNQVYPNLTKALEAVKRCPGIHTTDQDTGETFSDIIAKALT